MQALLAAMAAYSLLAATATQPIISSSFPTPNPNPHSLQSSSFIGLPLKSSRQTLKLATAPSKPFIVLAATKKAVVVLKGNSEVEGVVTLTQEDDGPTKLNVRITGLAPGLHGFHLHEYGDPALCKAWVL